MPSDLPPPRRALAAAGGCLLLAALALLVLRFDSGAVPRDRLFHPEAVYPLALYFDWSHRATWMTPFAPYFFPDLPLSFLAQATTGDPVLAVYLFAVLQFVLLVVGCRGLFGALLAHDAAARRLAGRLAVLLGTAMVLAFSAGFDGRGMLLQLFVAAFHTGAFVLAVYAQWVLLAVLDLPPPPARTAGRTALLLAALFLLTALGGLSDRLFLALFALPAVPILLLHAGGCRADDRRRAARGLAAAAVIGGGAIVGWRAVTWINAAGALRIPVFRPVDLGRLTDALRQLPAQEPDVAAFVVDRFFSGLGALYRGAWLAWLVLTLISVMAARSWLARRPGFGALVRLSPASRRNLAFHAAFTATSLVTTTLATVYVAVGTYAAGVGDGFHGLLFVNRYLLAFYVAPLVAPALYLPVLLGERRARRLEAPLLALLAALLVVDLATLAPPRPFPRRPADVACLDAKAAELDLELGLAYFYNHARRINVFSLRGLEVDQLTPAVEPYTWIASRRRRGADRGYDFVVTNQLDLDLLRARLGAPDHELDCAGLVVWAYDEARPLAPEARAER